jgi:hypothetical protein
MNSTRYRTYNSLTKGSLNYPFSNRLTQRDIGQGLGTSTHASLGESCSRCLDKSPR